MPARALIASAASLALLTASPAFAAAPAGPQASASKLSLANGARAGAPRSSANRLGGGGGSIFAIALGLGIAAIAVFAMLEETDDDGDDFPVSP